MDKAPDAFRTISEVADELDVPQHVLRFWETRFGQIRPMKRGGGRRYYRPDDVDLLRGIRHLLYGEGYTIRGVQGQIKEKGLKYVQEVWKQGEPTPAPVPSRHVEDDTDEESAGTAVTSDDEIEDEEPEEEQKKTAPSHRMSRANITAAPRAATDPTPPVAPQAPVARPTPQAAVPVGRGLSTEDIQGLRSALSELAECRRILEVVLKDTE